MKLSLSGSQRPKDRMIFHFNGETEQKCKIQECVGQALKRVLPVVFDGIVQGKCIF